MEPMTAAPLPGSRPVSVTWPADVLMSPSGGPAALVTSTLGEVVATSDVPGGVVNLLTGDHGQLLPWLADHEDVDLIDLSGAPADMVRGLEERAAANLKRTPRTGGREDIATATAFDDALMLTSAW